MVNNKAEPPVSKQKKRKFVNLSMLKKIIKFQFIFKFKNEKLRKKSKV